MDLNYGGRVLSKQKIGSDVTDSFNWEHEYGDASNWNHEEEWNQGLEATPAAAGVAGFHVPERAGSALRGWLLLARVPAVLPFPQKPPCFLETEGMCQPKAGQEGGQRTAFPRLASGAVLGVLPVPRGSCRRAYQKNSLRQKRCVGFTSLNQRCPSFSAKDGAF